MSITGKSEIYYKYRRITCYCAKICSMEKIIKFTVTLTARIRWIRLRLRILETEKILHGTRLIGLFSLFLSFHFSNGAPCFASVGWKFNWRRAIFRKTV